MNKIITKISFKGSIYDVGEEQIINKLNIKDKGEEIIDYTWQDIKNKITNGDFFDLKIGDYKKIQWSDSEEYTMQIAGIDTYRKYGESQHHIDWISKELINNITISYNSLNNNNGTATFQEPYLNSDIYKELSNKINLVSNEVSDLIIDKNLVIETRYQSSTTLDKSTGMKNINLGKLWIPTEYEVFGDAICGTDCFSIGNQIQYPLFIFDRSLLLKNSIWWTATVGDNDSKSICCVASDGSCTTISANSKNKIPLCFRL